MKAEPDLNDYVMRFYFLISEGHSLAVIYIYAYRNVPVFKISGGHLWTDAYV